MTLPAHSFVEAIAIDRQNPNTVYVGTVGVLNQILLIDPRNPDTVYAGTYDGACLR